MPEREERARRKLLAEFSGWESEIESDEDGESNEKILVKHLIVS